MNVGGYLHKVYAEEKTKPFVWGENDCFCLARKIAKHITGRDPIDNVPGTFTWNSELSAAKMLVANGCKNIGDAAARCLPEIPLSMVQTGDWVYIKQSDTMDGLGVVFGNAVMIRSVEGVGRVHLSAASRGFKIR